jgi:hypothetical protein
MAPEGPVKLSQLGSPCLKIFDFFDGGILAFFLFLFLIFPI